MPSTPLATRTSTSATNGARGMVTGAGGATRSRGPLARPASDPGAGAVARAVAAPPEAHASATPPDAHACAASPDDARAPAATPGLRSRAAAPPPPAGRPRTLG